MTEAERMYERKCLSREKVLLTMSRHWRLASKGVGAEISEGFFDPWLDILNAMDSRIAEGEYLPQMCEWAMQLMDRELSRAFGAPKC